MTQRTKMHKSNLRNITLWLIAALFAFAINMMPALAADEDEGNTQTVSESAPPASPTVLDPSMAMAASSNSMDVLGNFGPSSGTVVGNRAAALHDEALRLRSSVNLNSNEFAILRTSGAAGAVQYHSTVAAITARLQNGTTKGNPILLRQWEEADASLNEVTSSLNKLNSLQVAIDADASVASYLLESIQAAFELSGAVDEDHDQLKLLHDEVSRLVVQLDYLRNQTTADIERQSSYLTTERANLQALAFAVSRGELLGNSLYNRPVIVTPSPVATVPGAGSPSMGMAPSMPVTQGSFEQGSMHGFHSENGIATHNANVGIAPSVGRLLVLIRYNQPTVNYAQQLTQAVGTAVERRPNAEFSVIAVSPATGDPATVAEQEREAKDNADEVKRSLIQMGLAPNRISMASTEADTAQTPEVHVYVR